MSAFVKTFVHWHPHHKSQSPVQEDLCEICGKKPKFVENGFKHPYCSRSCARSGQGFCSEIHARDGVRLGQVKGCDQCRVQPRVAGNLCIICDRSSRSGTRIRELNFDSGTFKALRSHFSMAWQSLSNPVVVEKAYEVIVSRDVKARHDAYRATHPVMEEIRVFHSSQCICDLGTKEAVLCNFRSCGICNTLKSSFQAFAFGEPFNNGRYGDGIYSYKNPSLADRFATSCTSSPYRVMIACDAIIEPGQSLAGSYTSANEESIFVPTSEAIIPRFALMYTKE